MTPIAIVLFMCGTICLIVGAGRVFYAARAALSGAPTAHDTPDPRRLANPGSALGTAIRRTLPTVSWLIVAVYGLVLASVGIVVGR